MRGFKGIDLLPLKVLLDSTHFKYPFILQRPRAAFSLWRHRRLVSFLPFPPSNIYRVCQLCVTLPSEACSTKNTSENNKTSLYKVSGFVSEAFCRCGGVQSAGLIRGMSPLKGRPTAVCRFFPPPRVLTLPVAVVQFFCPITGSVDNESLLQGGRLMQQVGEICICMMDHCRMRLCFVSDKSFQRSPKAARSTQKRRSIWPPHLKSLLFFT